RRAARGNRLLLPGARLGQPARLDTAAKLQPAFYLHRWPFLRSGLGAKRLRRAIARRSAPCPRPSADRTRKKHVVAPSAGAPRFSRRRTLPAKFHPAFSIDFPTREFWKALPSKPRSW